MLIPILLKQLNWLNSFLLITMIRKLDCPIGMFDYNTNTTYSSVKMDRVKKICIRQVQSARHPLHLSTTAVVVRTAREPSILGLLQQIGYKKTTATQH
jgi:hypothetical protein